MSNEYFQPGSVPTPNAPGSSAIIRGEFTSVAAAFDKLPVMAGHANEIVAINGTGTGLVNSGILLADFATLTGVQTLTNKTIAWASNTFPGFGTGATKNAGTGAGEVLLLDTNNQLPALDGSLLTGITTGIITGVLDIEHGGTGASDLGGAQTALGIDLKADANNAVLTGAPTAPTPPTGDNSARIATTYFVTETVAAIGAFAPSNAAPLMNGVAASGVGVLGARDDHVHPTDTSRAPIASPVFTGNPTAPTPTPGDNDTSIATTAFVNAEIAADRPYSDTNPLINGAAAQGVSPRVSRQDHVHPTDTSRAPIASPVFTGDPKAPTPLTSDNDTSIATTAFVQSLLAQQPAAGMQPSNATPLINGAATPGTGVDGSRYDHVHPTDTSRAPIASPVFTGDPKAPTPTPGDNDTSIATTAFVNAEIAADRPYSDTNPLINGAAAQGVSPRVSRQDHVHPTDTSRAPIASPVFTGTASFGKIAVATMFAGAGGTEGGELWLEKPASGSTIVGNGVVDLSSDAIRFFESGGTYRGAYIHLPSCAGGVGSAIWHQGNDGAGSGLDADLLDGQQGGYYAPKANPTFTGMARSNNSRAVASWDGAQFVAYSNAGSAVDFASTAYHVQDATSAPQWGYNYGDSNRFGLYSSDGLTRLFTLPETGIGSGVLKIVSGDVTIATPSIDYATPADVAAVKSVGVGQVWHNHTGARSLNVTYYNATAQPMQVHITTGSTDISHIGTLTVGGVLVGRATQPSGGYAIIHAAVIPPGASYVVAQNGPSASISNWAELY